MRAHVDELFRLHYDTINELREIAECCKADEDRFNHISALRTLGQLTGKNIELAVGKTISLNMTMRSQEDLVDWATLPPEVQQKASALFDAAVAAGVDFGSPLRGLPTMGEATRVWEGDRPPRGAA